MLGKGAAAVVALPIAAKLLAQEPAPQPPVLKRSPIKWYSGYYSFSPPTSADVLDAAEFQWKQLSGFISVRGIGG